MTLPLLLPSIAQEIADALSKKPLTVTKRNELAMERARTFKHEDDIDLMVRSLWPRLCAAAHATRCNTHGRSFFAVNFWRPSTAVLGMFDVFRSF